MNRRDTESPDLQKVVRFYEEIQHGAVSVMLKGPNQATFLPSYGQIASMALEELSSGSVNGRTTRQTDDRQKVITISHPKHS